MTKSLKRRTQPTAIPQLMLAFPGKMALDPKPRSQVIALLSRLLLQAAKASREVHDDSP